MTRLLLTLGATLRLTRLITTDDLGQWWVRDPLVRYLSARPELARRYGKYLSGLDCPFCVGFWLGVLVLASGALARHHQRTSAAWSGVATALTLNYLAGHLAARLDS